MENKINKFEGVANTLFLPLVARIAISKEFPEYFFDSKALELEPYLPEGVSKGSSQYSNIASVSRYYNMDIMVKEYAHKNGICNVVYLGAGLESAYDRLSNELKNVKWYEVDLPEVIEARQKVFGSRANETLIAGDMFKLEWINDIDTTIPTLLIISGVFQYFHEDEVIKFIKDCDNKFNNEEIIFDATSKSGLIYTNWFIKRTGNKSSLMYFGIDDTKEFADKCNMKLVEVRTFYKDALVLLKNKVNIITKISMKVAEKNKQVLILHLK